MALVSGEAGGHFPPPKHPGGDDSDVNLNQDQLRISESMSFDQSKARTESQREKIGVIFI